MIRGLFFMNLWIFFYFFTNFFAVLGKLYKFLFIKKLFHAQSKLFRY